MREYSSGSAAAFLEPWLFIPLFTKLTLDSLWKGPGTQDPPVGEISQLLAEPTGHGVTSSWLRNGQQLRFPCRKFMELLRWWFILSGQSSPGYHFVTCGTWGYQPFSCISNTVYTDIIQLLWISAIAEYIKWKKLPNVFSEQIITLIT